MGVYTGVVPQLPAGAYADADKLAEITNFMTAATAPWSTWTPTWTNLTVGSGTVLARYRQLGKTVDYRLKFLLGAGSALTASSPTFTLPVTPHGGFVVDDLFGHGHAADATINTYVLGVFYNGGGIARFNTTSTVPFAYGNGDWFESVFTYEAA